ncbi:CPBP family intramembrane glutamic endopeptidase [Anaerobium acetethylicum]|uniref:CAAX prenyl protease 2/Lysostaphin resistance protein A-like domain-containing protein n=1 Tax=Anaerobium acetethylicum TaxID=1619234 RepID=A0A1D3TUS5_9FIRM|nr:CPBP family intramembrane glutamic endopeptidase [Anaerobium acetethylicum]SCP97801.1 hypothetical protein SAMN05421730_10147 [Anaerobium acetethylicum]
MFKNYEGKVRSGWKILGVTAVFFALTVVCSFIGGLILAGVTVARGFNPITYLTTEDGLKLMGTFEKILMFAQELIMIFTPLIAWRFIMKRPLSNMGLGSIKKHGKDLTAGLLFGAVSMSIVFAVIVMTGSGVVASWTPQVSTDTFVYLLLFILVGFAEEIYGRGFIMSALRQTRNVPVVVIVSSIIFSLLHSMNPGINFVSYFNIFLVGLLFAYMYLKSGNIWMCIGYHITWNYFQGNVFGFPVSGTNTQGLISTTYPKENAINGGVFGPEGGLVVTAILIFSFLVVKRFYKNAEFDFLAGEPVVEMAGVEMPDVVLSDAENFTIEKPATDTSMKAENKRAAGAHETEEIYSE